MIGTKDLGFLAGLYEGEGCFQYANSPRVALGMTDKDVVERVQTLVGGTIRVSLPKGNRQPVYFLVLNGSKAVGLMMTLYSQLGTRRQAKIRELLERWKKSPGIYGRSVWEEADACK